MFKMYNISLTRKWTKYFDDIILFTWTYTILIQEMLSRMRIFLHQYQLT